MLCFLSVGCVKNYEQLTLFKRKIVRTDLISQSFDNYTMGTTISQILSAEGRTNYYNFNQDTKLIYDTVFINVPSIINYSFDNDGKVNSIEYEYFFTKENAESEINDVYDECIKFFGYPDEGYTRGIYENLHMSPSILWVKNNAFITLDLYLDDQLNAIGKLKYFRSDWSGSHLSTFKLPFTINALGDRIDSVVGSESKKFSEHYNSIVGYSYKKDGLEWYKTNYTFKGQFLNSIDLKYYGHDLNDKQMDTLTADMIDLMNEEFDGAQVVDKSKDEYISIQYISEAASIKIYRDNARTNREIIINVVFQQYMN